MTTYLIRLPWPPKDLHAHAKGHWRKKAAATKAYRADACKAARESGVHRSRMPDAILEFSYYPPDRRRRDVANLAGAPMKAAIDGIADAMGCDDNGFFPRFPDRFSEPTEGGAILVTVRGE